MKKMLMAAAALLMAAAAQAAAVAPDAASRVAVNFWNSHRPAASKPVVGMDLCDVAGFDHLYVFHNRSEGFVIVSADDCVQPVLAYAFDAPFPEKPHPSLAYWLRGYEDQIAEAAELGYSPTDEVRGQWKRLLGEQVVEAEPLLLTLVPAMVRTRWDQGSPYNMYCPIDSVRGCQTVVGCVATAMAQIMKYWEYPSFGQGSHSYTYWNISGSADFGATTYLWQFMPSIVSDASLTYQREAVATLSYHCGVAVDMMYGCSDVGGSGAFSRSVVTAMHEYFKYDAGIRPAYRYNYSDSAWCAMLDAELDAGQPLYYAGSDTSGGHAFVLDGSDSAQRYHFNWGWSGYGDGFYTINNLAPGTSGQAGGNATYTFNLYQEIICGIKPGAVETFDTVDYYDSICTDSRYIQFHEYSFLVGNFDTMVRHLDTIFRYHLKVIPQKYIVLEPNGGTGESFAVNYCPATGVELPECRFTKAKCRFVGWCRNRNGQNDTLQPGTHVMLNTNRHYYALWEDTTIVGIATPTDSPVALWPNPTQDDLTVSLATDATAQVTVIDALGRSVRMQTLRGGGGKISLSGLPAGAYIVQVKTEGDVYNRRVIKR